MFVPDYFCKCENIERSGTRLNGGLLFHVDCGKPLICVRCEGQVAAANVGPKGAECQYCSPLFSDDFFGKELDLERSLIDGFVYEFGGKRVTDLIDGKPDFSNADYYFQEADVVTELKTLKTEFAQTPEHLNRFEALVDEWRSDGRLSDAAWAGTEPIPREFVQTHLRMIRDQIEGITKKANKQIRQTKEKLNLPDAKGLVLYLNDGFYQADPNLTLALIGDPLQRQMRSVDGFVLFNLREKVFIPGEAGGNFIWLPKYRSADDVRLSEFVNELGAAWFRYLEDLSGQEFKHHIESRDPDHPELTNATYGR